MQTLIIRLADSDIITGRDSGLELRRKVEQAIDEDPEQLVLDFSGIRNATQSCLDEMIGILLLERGAGVLNRLVFKGCTPALREMIQFVVSDRMQSQAPVPR